MAKKKKSKRKSNKRKSLILFLVVIVVLIADYFTGGRLLQSLNLPYAGSTKTTSSEGIDNLLLGVPGPADTIINREGYALGYSEKHEQPAWVTYKLTRDEVKTKNASRTDDFRADPEIPTGSASLDDYRGSGYSRGHLAPAADMKFSAQAMSESFYLSNMSPQESSFNAGIWASLENQMRTFAVYEGAIYIVTGPILPAEKTVTIGKNRVTVPDSYYKVVYDTTPPVKMIGFIMPHKNSSQSLKSFAVTVDAVEKATGLNFFSALPQDEQERLKHSIDLNAWKWD